MEEDFDEIVKHEDAFMTMNKAIKREEALEMMAKFNKDVDPHTRNFRSQSGRLLLLL